MLRHRRPLTRALVATAAALLILGAAVLFSGRSPAARAASVGSLQQRISAGQGKISALAGAVSAASNHLGQLNASLGSLQNQISRIQADLNAKRAELLRLRTELAAARIRLAQLEAFEAHAQTVLAQQLVNGYESDHPDIMSVVLNATGFRDLLERLSFAQRIQNQSVQVVTEVRAARRAVAAQATRLGALEVRQQTLTAEVLQQRNALARTQLRLEQQQLAVAQSRNAKAGELATVRSQVAGYQRQLSAIEAAQAAATVRAAAATAPGTGPSGATSVSPTQVSSGGGFTFPLPKGSASGPGTWSMDQGVDISAPGGTPEFAVCSGTIVLHGIGGFGPSAPVLHCDSPLGGYSYVYYGHAGPGNQLAVGTRVGAGQVMSEIGSGIVGISTGPHLEIGFCDGSGTPSGGAGTMMSLLQGAYGG
jgi:murein DD-endopeptidase MepM/ murein hydrolase activator NlpD